MRNVSIVGTDVISDPSFVIQSEHSSNGDCNLMMSQTTSMFFLRNLSLLRGCDFVLRPNNSINKQSTPTIYRRFSVLSLSVVFSFPFEIETSFLMRAIHSSHKDC